MMAAIITAVERDYDLAAGDILSRNKSHARPRQVAYWLARELTGLSYPKLGRAFGRTHDTVLRGIRSLEGRRRSCSLFNDYCTALRDGLKEISDG